MDFGSFYMKKAVLFASLLLAGAVLTAQEAIMDPGSREVPPAPVVSGLVAGVSGQSVTLAWIQAPNITGENIILRSNRPITAANYETAEKRGVLPVATTTFTDTIEDGKDYYYAILSRDATGAEYDFFIPASNSLLVAVSTGKTEEPAKIAAFSGFDAMQKDDSVLVAWTASIRKKNLILYRSTSPFSGMSSLPQAIVVASFVDTGSPYIDYPVPGVSYYYAILDEDSLRTGNAAFVPGANTSAIPVEIPTGTGKIQRPLLPVLRPMPLPWLNPSHEADVTPAKFSQDTERIIRALAVSPEGKASVEREPYVFKSDLSSSSAGEEYSLRKIIATTFGARAWDKSITELNDFLSIRRSEVTQARAHFYLGEAYYFSKNYRQALLELLLAEDRYYNQSREWIQYVLDRMD
jgi:hypothetical protein